MLGVTAVTFLCVQIIYFDHVLLRHPLSPPTLPTYFPLIAPLLKAFMPFWNMFLSPLAMSRITDYFYTSVQVPTVCGSSYLKGCISPAKRLCTEFSPYKLGRAQEWAGPGRGQFGHSLCQTPSVCKLTGYRRK